MFERFPVGITGIFTSSLTQILWYYTKQYVMLMQLICPMCSLLSAEIRHVIFYFDLLARSQNDQKKKILDRFLDNRYSVIRLTISKTGFFSVSAPAMLVKLKMSLRDDVSPATQTHDVVCFPLPEPREMTEPQIAAYCLVYFIGYEPIVTPYALYDQYIEVFGMKPKLMREAFYSNKWK